jgi:hypothetical protein
MGRRYLTGRESTHQTEDVFRSANERIAGKARELRWQFPVPFLCECSDTDCFARIELVLDEYEKMRSHPQRYLTVSGHELVGAFPIEQSERVAVVEKLYARADSN